LEEFHPPQRAESGQGVQAAMERLILPAVEREVEPLEPVVGREHVVAASAPAMTIAAAAEALGDLDAVLPSSALAPTLDSDGMPRRRFGSVIGSTGLGGAVAGGGDGGGAVSPQPDDDAAGIDDPGAEGDAPGRDPSSSDHEAPPAQGSDTGGAVGDESGANGGDRSDQDAGGDQAGGGGSPHLPWDPADEPDRGPIQVPEPGTLGLLVLGLLGCAARRRPARG
jgi:hypothetical protein